MADADQDHTPSEQTDEAIADLEQEITDEAAIDCTPSEQTDETADDLEPDAIEVADADQDHTPPEQTDETAADLEPEASDVTDADQNHTTDLTVTNDTAKERGISALEANADAAFTAVEEAFKERNHKERSLTEAMRMRRTRKTTDHPTKPPTLTFGNIGVF